MYRRTFVGRDAELKQLHNAFDEALAGHGSLSMVFGEPGIGKTSLCGQLAGYVADKGGKTLIGHCYEEGSLSLPYPAFVEAARSHVLILEPADLKAQLGHGADELARIVPEIRERVQVELSPPGDPEEERYRLLQAASDYLRNAAAQPLLVVLEFPRTDNWKIGPVPVAQVVSTLLIGAAVAAPVWWRRTLSAETGAGNEASFRHASRAPAARCRRRRTEGSAAPEPPSRG